MAGGVRVSVDGVYHVIGALTAFGTRSGDLKPAFRRIGLKVAQEAKPLTPRSTGALARSIRAGNQKMKATVRAGGASRRTHGGGVYAPIAHFGKYTHRSKGPRPFLYQAARQNRDYAQHEIQSEIRSIIRRMGLSS